MTQRIYRSIHRLAAAGLCLALLLSCAPCVQGEEALNLASQAAVVIDAETGTVLYEKNLHQTLYPASITKVMTAMLACQSLEPEQILTVSQAAVNAVPRTSSHISLAAGEQLTVEQALYSIGMESANDAANVLAEAVSGSLDAFAQKMTETAQALGATNTHFANANGLPDSEHYTTAYDMALITAAAWKQGDLAKYFSTVNYTLPATNLSTARNFQNKDRLLEGGQYYYPGVQMAKTGWTTAAQGTFVAVVTQGDTTLVVVTLKSPLLEDKYKDTHKLLDYAFSHYTRVTVSGERLAAGQELGDYSAVSGQKFSYLIPSDMSAQDICYTIAEPLETSRNKQLTRTVTVSATLNELRLTDVQLKLERPEEPRVAFSLAELLQSPTAALERLPVIPRYLVVIGVGAGTVLLLLWLRRQIQRHRRRKHLKARIRRMKKKMEP